MKYINIECGAKTIASVKEVSVGALGLSSYSFIRYVCVGAGGKLELSTNKDAAFGFKSLSDAYNCATRVMNGSEAWDFEF